MNTKVFYFFIFLFISTICNAQSKFGVHAGFSQSKTPFLLEEDKKLLILDRLSNEWRLGIAAPIEISLVDWSSIVVEPSFFTESSSIQAKLPNGDEQIYYTHTRLHYFRLPLYFKLKLNLKQYTLYGGLGGSVNYAVAGNYTNWQSNRSSINFQSEELSRWDYGAVLSVGIEKKVAHQIVINLNVHYYLGLKNIHLYSTQELYNESYAILMGLSSPIFKKK